MRWAKFTAPAISRFFSIKRCLNISASVGLSALLITFGLAVVNSPKVSAAGNIYSPDAPIIIEGNDATFRFTLIGPESYSYRYITSPVSATPGKDYVSKAGPLDYSCGQTRVCPKTITVPITTIDDTEYEPGPDETFIITVISTNNDGFEDVEGEWIATIKDNDSAPAAPTPTPAPTPPTTTTPTPTPIPPVATLTPNPTPDPTPAPKFTPGPEVLGTSTPEPPTLVTKQSKPVERSRFVQSVPSPQDLKPTFKKVAKAFVIAALLVLLIMFPADLFNGTLQSNYDEVIGWFKMDYVGNLHRKLQLHRVPIAIVLSIFAALVTLLNTQLSPDFGFNRASGALLLGMFIALTTAATVYDLSRALYLKKRFGISGKLRAHALGLGVGALFVTISRMAHFVPGYLYGLFTGLIFNQKSGPTDEQDGEGLALASVVVLAFAIAGWFALIPVRSAATQTNASFIVLTVEAALATLWVSALGMIVFSLAPLRFMYGEQVKKWNKYAWAAIYGSGMLLFVYTLLDPNQSVYGKSSTTSWISVLSLFFGFGIFSVAFWGYFRYRPLWKKALRQAS